jgi:hypothetical protein
MLSDSNLSIDGLDVREVHDDTSSSKQVSSRVLGLEEFATGPSK